MSLLGQVKLMFDTDAFKRAVEETVHDYKAAGKKAVTTTTGKATRAMQAATAGAGLGKLSKAWKSKVYPTGDALNPAGYIYVAGADRSQGAMRAYIEGGTIRPKDGHRYIAIPLPAAGKAGRSAMTPKAFTAKTGLKLQFVPHRGRHAAMLVAVGQISAKTNRFRKATAKQTASGNHATIPMFILIPEARIHARFSIEGVMGRFGAELATEFVRQVQATTRKAGGE